MAGGDPHLGMAGGKGRLRRAGPRTAQSPCTRASGPRRAGSAPCPAATIVHGCLWPQALVGVWVRDAPRAPLKRHPVSTDHVFYVAKQTRISLGSSRRHAKRVRNAQGAAGRWELGLRHAPRHVGGGPAWRRPARPRVPTGRAARVRAPTGRAHAQGGAPPLPRGEGVYGEAAAAAAEAEAEAAAMAPFPEEVDVFTAPHWRMKQLVGLYCDKVTACVRACVRGRLLRAAGRSGPVPGRPGLRRARRPRAAPPPVAGRRLRSCQRRARRPAASDVPSGRAAGSSWRGAASRGRACLLRLRPEGEGHRAPGGLRVGPLRWAPPQPGGEAVSAAVPPPPSSLPPRSPRPVWGAPPVPLQTPIHPSSEPRACFLAPGEASPNNPPFVR